MTARRARAALAAVFLSCIPTAHLVAPPAPASAYTAKASQLNICGAYCHRPNKSNYRTKWGHDLLVFYVMSENPAPWLVTAQETCGVQSWSVGSTLSSRGYLGRYFPTLGYNTVCQGSFGDSLWAIGPDVGGPGSFQFSASTHDGQVLPDEKRQVGCQQKQNFGFTWFGCVLHTVDTANGDPYAQAAEAAWVTGSTATRIVGGDFNVAPPVNNGWPNSWEADQSLARTALLATMSDTTLENKIDYVFSPTAWFPASVGVTSCSTAAARSSTAQYTDHCYLLSTFSNSL